jgi:hypothetical protein
MALAPTSWTGTTWQGNYGPSGQLYYYGGKAFQSPQELYAALGQPYDAGSLPYGTTVYGPNYNSGMSDWDQSVRNNPYGNLDQIGQSTAGLYANASSGMTQPSATQPTSTTGQDSAAMGTSGTTGAVPFSTQYPGPTNVPWTPAGGTDATATPKAASTVTTNTPAGTATPESTTTTTGGGSGTVNSVGTPAGNYLPGPNSTTPADVFNPLDDPRQSVYRALVANGYNPEVPTWGINQLLKRASDIAWGAAGRTAWGGNPDVITTPGALQDYINSLVGMSGKGGIMPTAQQGSDYLNAINTLMQGTNRSQGATYLSSLLGANPDAAAGLAERLRYGAFAPGVRSALGGPLQNFGTRFAQFVESPEGFGVARDHNALDILLNNLIPGYRPLF